MALTTIKTGGLADNSVTDAKVADAITVTGAQTGITQVGTLTAGVWNSSTKIASAYLDDDTAHLSGTQTFSGAKTFTDGVHFKGSAWNDIMIIGDTSRSNEEETHIRNGEVNFSISVNDGTYAAFAANHDGSAMTLGGDFGSGTLTVVPSTTFSGKVTVDNDSAEHLTLKRNSSHWWDMQVGSNGNLNIQKNSATDTIIVEPDGDTTFAGNITTAGGMIITQADGSNTDAYFGLGNDADYGQIGANEIGLWNVNNNDIIFGTNNNLRMTIKNDGKVGVGDTSPDSKLHITDAHSNAPLVTMEFTGGGGKMVAFITGGTENGNITEAAGNIQFNTSSSDKTLKKNFDNWTENVLDSFDKINPQLFNYSFQDDDVEKTKGFIAQEMIDKFPEAYPLVDYEQEDKKTKKYQFNPSGMVVYLMKAVQELSSKVEALENA